MQCTGFAGGYSPRSMFPSVGDRPKMLDIMAGTDQMYRLCRCLVGLLVSCTSHCFSCPVVSWPVWIRSTVMSVLGRFAGIIPRPVFLPAVWPKMRCIMAVMDQKESLLAVACARLVLRNAWSSVIHDLRQSTDW